MSTSQPRGENNGVVGTWRLTSFTVDFSDGRATVTPYTSGQIIYAASGHMSAVLAQHPPGQSPLAHDDQQTSPLEHAVRMDDAAKATAFDAFLSYAGRYRIDGDAVFHDVDFSLAPAAVGQTLKRRFVRDGDTLTLSYDRKRKSGVVMDYTLTWTRCG